MRRVRLDLLEERSGVLYHQGKLFDGIAYDIKNHQVIANYRVNNGNLEGPAEDWNSSQIRVPIEALFLVSEDETCEHHPEAGAYLGDAFFDGIAYVFDPSTGVLLREQDLGLGATRSWYPSGQLKSELDRQRPDGTYESETWYESGRSAGVESLNLGYGYTLDGRLRRLGIAPECPKSEIDGLTFKVDSILDLAGPGISDRVVEQFVDLRRVEHLELHRTAISPAGLARFCDCTGLKFLRTRKNSGFGEADVKALLARLPNCSWDGRL